MRKTALFYLFVFLLFFLAGCAGGGESVGLSEKEENASPMPGETVSSRPMISRILNQRSKKIRSISKLRGMNRPCTGLS